MRFINWLIKMFNSWQVPYQVSKSNNWSFPHLFKWQTSSESWTCPRHYLLCNCSVVIETVLCQSWLWHGQDIPSRSNRRQSDARYHVLLDAAVWQTGGLQDESDHPECIALQVWYNHGRGDSWRALWTLTDRLCCSVFDHGCSDDYFWPSSKFRSIIFEKV